MLILAGVALFGGPLFSRLLCSLVMPRDRAVSWWLRNLMVLICPAAFVGTMYLLIVNTPEAGMGLVLPYLATPVGALASLVTAASFTPRRASPSV